ncbi:putative hydro-lyase [Azospirillum brasilense]|uniref:putative hydro-lyase n=1 Tax=Azospirillum brasilense TaxID=192 RepID=UPI000E681716|nr:putative hydro-lyase [Azospirillum brasilense]NUB27169.1 putative hydro-lyase [Azospirillum brasilense]NUB35460.1 putative hydro-lyase [Azospirillum brasilense]RIV97756.1 putative hydro-lyase [Azospirillum brasilense]
MGQGSTQAASAAVCTPATPAEVRAMIRDGYTGYTGGKAPGYVQANICILPKDYAEEFLLFCQRNPAPCPLLERADQGSYRLPRLGKEIDIRTDLPRYHVFRDGVFCEEVTDIRDLWSNELVTFALGCSFSFEEALREAGLPMRFMDRGGVAGVYQTDIETQPAGRFHAKLVVTMRPFAPADAIRAIQVTSRFPNVHGAPVHIGDPAAIGVDLSRRYRDVGSDEILPHELPLFWACGLTPQLAVANAKPPLCITHAPSSMLVTDIRNASLASF